MEQRYYRVINVLLTCNWQPSTEPGTTESGTAESATANLPADSAVPDSCWQNPWKSGRPANDNSPEVALEIYARRRPGPS